MELIGKFVTRAAASGFGWIATLQHEAFDHAVERYIVVVAAAREVEEIGASQWGL